MHRLILGALVASALTFAACGDEDDEPTPTTQPAATTAAASNTPEEDEPTETPTTAATRTPTAGPTANPDGTIDPLNPGDTETKTVKSNPDPITGLAILDDVRVGYHPEEGGWERIVFEFQEDIRPPAEIGYTEEPITQCGSGNPVEVEGEAILHVRIDEAQAHTPEGETTIDSQEIDTPPGGDTILEGVQTCDFEGLVEWAFGLAGEQNFKVTTLENPTRIVIDIKQ